MKKNPKQIL